jgi:hypothetical protein
VEAIFIDVGTDGRDLSDLVSQGIGIVSPQRGATASAVGRLDLDDLSKSFGRDQRSGMSWMPGLSSTLAPGGWDRRSPLDLDGRGICGGGLRRIGGVEVEPGFQLGDPLLQRGEGRQESRLGLRRDGVPERFRDRRMRAHTTGTTSLLYKAFGRVNGYA